MKKDLGTPSACDTSVDNNNNGIKIEEMDAEEESAKKTEEMKIIGKAVKRANTVREANSGNKEKKEMEM